MNRRVLVLGSAGQLGVELVREFSGRGYEVIGRTRSELDVTDATKIDDIIAGLKPSLIVNATAYNGVDAAEDEPMAAMKVNGLAVRTLALACERIDAALVHFSTDYVFDGTKGEPYGEDDYPHPLGAYGVSKLTGESYAQAYHDRSLVIRTSAVFGPQGRYTARGNFIELMLRRAAAGQPIRVVTDCVASPTYAPALAAHAIDLVERGAHGLFHGGGGAAISWFEYAKMIFRLADVRPDLVPIVDCPGRTIARRPRYSALSNTRMKSLGLEHFPSLECAVQSYFQMRDDAATKC